MTKMFQIALYKVCFAKEMEKLNAELAKFQESFAKNPYDAMRWADKVFDLAAEKELAMRLNYWIEAEEKNGATELAEDFYKVNITRTLIEWSRYMSRSTSPSSNLAEDALMKQHARLLEGAFGCPVLDAIKDAIFKVEWENQQEKLRKASFRIKHKSQDKWRKDTGGWTKDAAKALLVSYETKSTRDLEADERWEVDPATMPDNNTAAYKAPAPTVEA